MENVQQLKQRLRSVSVGGRRLFLAEGDLLMDEEQLKHYVSSSEPPPPSAAAMKELLGITEEGQIVRWRPGTVLSYCILEGFTREQHKQISADLLEATQDWMNTCGVEFKHLSQHDGARTPPKDVLFCVRFVDAGGEFIAAAFFPNDSPDRREIVIDPSHFTQRTFPPVGVLRHELGHVLGFRHEHIRSQAPAICPKEGLTDTIELSAYDPQSVMHYFCGGLGFGDQGLAITKKDIVAAQIVYGLPLSSLRFVDP